MLEEEWVEQERVCLQESVMDYRERKRRRVRERERGHRDGPRLSRPAR